MSGEAEIFDDNQTQIECSSEASQVRNVLIR